MSMKRNFQALARIGIAAAAASIPLIFTTATQASPLSQNLWDLLAQCESSENWSINTGNGYYGGLQFSHETWRAYGGGAFAPTADRATRSQQIAIAEKVLRAQGWKAWPTCSRKLGLR
jgi:resuscitation-promoting factor RpfA